MRDDLKAELVLDALGMAVTARGCDAAGVVTHSDHGSQTRLNQSSQQLAVDLIVNVCSALPPVFSSRVSCVVGR